jgi:transcriptional regulator NrdR family protein
LSFRGGVDPSASGSFKTATDFLEWFYSDTAYPDLREPLPQPNSRAVTTWWPPRTPKLPEFVIKRDGTRKKFGFEQFKSSVSVALLGRPHAEETAHHVALFALFHVEGQPIVRSSQLADQAMSTLRMVDDIAYLRFAGIAKDFVSVRDFASEAHGLIGAPSPSLRFAPDNLKAAVPVGNFGIKQHRER